MNVEGIGVMLSPEWLRATSTVIPVLVAMWWILELRAALWRRTMWREIGGAARRLEAMTRGRLAARGAGFTLVLDDGAIHWRGGVSGPRTVIRIRGVRQRVDRWLGDDGLAHLLQE